MAGTTVDRVIVELEAKLDRYRADVTRAERNFEESTRRMRRAADQMERSITRSSLSAGASIRTMAATLAGAFSLQQIQQLADGYTRFTNQLKVAGLEGQVLGQTQEKLFGIAQKYGVELESLGTLFSRSSQVAKELNANQADLIKFSTGVSAALKIQGTSATESRGALLQLSQLLATGTVRAEEFNSVNEGALPVLKAVAQNLDAAGGSVGKLKLLVNDGKVSSDEFFRAFLAGSAQLEAQALKTNLTIGNSFTILNNALGKFIGETDQSLSATERISQAIIKLSENLGTVAKALGVIGAILLGRFVAGMVGAAASTGLASAALFALQARALGAATTMEALAFAGRAAGASMLAAFGGPVGLAVAALAVGVYYLTTRTSEAEQASAAYAAEQARLKDVQDKTSDATDRLATATGKARVEALRNAEALRQETIQYLANARAALAAATAKARTARINAQAEARVNDTPGAKAMGVPMGIGGGFNPSSAATAAIASRAEAKVAAADKIVKDFEAEIKRLDTALKAPPPVVTTAPGKPDKKKTGGKSAPKGMDPDDIARRFADDMARGQLDYEAAMTELAGTAEARYGLAVSQLRAEHARSARDTLNDDNYSAAQKEQLLLLNDRVKGARLDALRAVRDQEIAQETLELRLGDLQNTRDLTGAQANLVTSLKDKLAAELRIIDLQEQEERMRLEAIRDNERLNAAEREAARRRLAILPELYGAERESAKQQNEGVGAKYLRGLNSTDINEQLDEVRVRGLQTLEDKIVDVTASIFKMGGAFGDIANQIISDLIRIGVQKAIIAPLAGALFGGGEGLGGIIGSIFGGGGRASGGHVNAGQLYQVNERPGGVEGFRPAGSGKIIPLGQMNQARVATEGGGGMGDIYMPITVSAPGANAQTVALIRQTISDAAPALVQAAQRATMRQLSRKRIS